MPCGKLFGTRSPILILRLSRGQSWAFTVCSTNSKRRSAPGIFGQEWRGESGSERSSQSGNLRALSHPLELPRNRTKIRLYLIKWEIKCGIKALQMQLVGTGDS